MDTKALRQKILDLAIRGKLVPQDPNDKPASVLLERIRQQKQQMVKEGKLKPKDIKKDSVIFVGEDNLHYEKFADGRVKCIEDEIPFELPDGWIWCRLSQIITLFSGQDLDPSRYNNEGIGIPYITGASNLEDGKVVINRWTDSPTTHATDGDLLITCKGSGVGKMAWCDICDAHIARQIMALRCVDGLLSGYLEIVISAMLSNIRLKANGLIPGLSREIILEMMFPLPSLEEQKRICSKSREILSYIDGLNSQKSKLVGSVGILKSKILDLAIRGQLVPQNPADEPASVLLERIRAEKEELIKQGIIKRDKKESVIFRGEDNSYYVRQDTHMESIDEQFIFELPDNWEWCSLLNIAKIELGKTLDSAKNIGTNYPYLRSVNVRWNEVDLSDLKEMRFEPEELDRYTVRHNDLLICEGGDVGRSCVWTDEKEILYQNALHRVRFYGGCNPFYFMYYMMYYESRGIIKALCKGVTIKHLTGNVLSLIPFALPPIEEQDRIVKRLNRIFVLLDSIICD